MRRLIVAALLVLNIAAFALLSQPAIAQAPPPSRAELAIYVRGWIDGAAPTGVYVIRSACSAARVCIVRLSDGSCAQATVTGYAFPGPWHHCAKHKTGPPA